MEIKRRSKKLNGHIYSTTLYCDDKIKYAIYVMALDLNMAKDAFRLDYDLVQLKHQYNDTCHYSLTQIAESVEELDPDEQELFVNNKRVVIFEGESI